mgnify:CR=1 FL=1
MYNWSVDTKNLKKTPQKYTIWRLEQLINFGLNGEKINTVDLKRYWPYLNLDPNRKKVLEYWLR